MNDSNDEKVVRQWLTLGLIFVLIVSFVYFALGLFGYSKLDINTAAGSTVRINGRVVHNGTVKIHPGTYNITIASPLYSSSPVVVSVKPFQSKNITDSTFVKRNPEVILRSILGGYDGFGAPSLYSAKYFQNNTWLAGMIGPGSTQPIALQYDKGVWSIYYFSDNGYSHDTNDLPADVGTYIQQLKADNSDG